MGFEPGTGLVEAPILVRWEEGQRGVGAEAGREGHWEE